MIPDIVPVVCFATDNFCRRPELYLNRLHGMLSRHMPVPFALTCFSDRPRRTSKAVEIKDCSDWSQLRRENMRSTTLKLGLFDPELLNYPEFLYLDLSLVIRSDMKPLLEYAFNRPEDLVIVNDWNYACYNSCVMRIRRGPLRTIYDAFVDGKSYPQRNQGDQDFLYNHIAAEGMQDHVACFPDHQIVSYLNARNLNRTDSQSARQMIENAVIVKFFGKNKMHQVADPLWNLRKIRLRNRPFGARDAAFFLRELRREWRN